MVVSELRRYADGWLQYFGIADMKALIRCSASGYAAGCGDVYLEAAEEGLSAGSQPDEA